MIFKVRLSNGISSWHRCGCDIDQIEILSVLDDTDIQLMKFLKEIDGDMSAESIGQNEYIIQTDRMSNSGGETYGYMLCKQTLIKYRDDKLNKILK